MLPVRLERGATEKCASPMDDAGAAVGHPKGFRMSVSAAAIAAWLLAHPSWLDRDVTREDRAPLVRLDLRTDSIADLPRAIDLASGLVLVPRDDRPTMPCPAYDPEAPESREVGR